jgi:hypothetical protein
LAQETAVACLVKSHSFWLALAAILLVTAKTVAHKKAIMVTSNRPACFVGFFIRECLKVDLFVSMCPEKLSLCTECNKYIFNFKLTDELKYYGE